MLRKDPSKFPLWQFLNQPLFDARVPLVLSPKKFARQYRLEHLSKCWKLDHEIGNQPKHMDEI